MRGGAIAAVLLALAVLATEAPAGDGKPGQAKKDEARVYPEAEWVAKVKDIGRIDAVGVKKKDVLAFEAARSVVLVRVKIWEVRPTQDGVAIDVVEVVPSLSVTDNDRLPRDPILLGAAEKDAVKDWKRWDRVSFKVKPKVSPDGFLSYDRLIAGAADIARVANPGVEYPPPPRSAYDADVFGDWVVRYARACEVPDWRTAWKLYVDAASHVFPMSATVREGALDANGRGPRGPVSLDFDISKSTGITGYGLVDGQGHPTTSARVLIEDPQVAEALRAGARAELWFRVTGFDGRDDLMNHRGRFRVEVRFGRLR